MKENAGWGPGLIINPSKTPAIPPMIESGEGKKRFRKRGREESAPLLIKEENSTSLPGSTDKQPWRKKATSGKKRIEAGDLRKGPGYLYASREGEPRNEEGKRSRFHPDYAGGRMFVICLQRVPKGRGVKRKEAFLRWKGGTSTCVSGKKKGCAFVLQNSGGKKEKREGRLEQRGGETSFERGRNGLSQKGTVNKHAS